MMGLTFEDFKDRAVNGEMLYIGQYEDIELLGTIFEHKLYIFTREVTADGAIKTIMKGSSSDCDKTTYCRILDVICNEIYYNNHRGDDLKKWDKDTISNAVCTYDNYGRRIMIEDLDGDRSISESVLNIPNKRDKKPFWNTDFVLVSKTSLDVLLQTILKCSWQSVVEAGLDKLYYVLINNIDGNTLDSFDDLERSVGEIIHILNGDILFGRFFFEKEETKDNQ